MDESLCAECGKPMFVDDSGVAFHGEPGAVDFEADADHVAIDERPYLAVLFHH